MFELLFQHMCVFTNRLSSFPRRAIGLIPRDVLWDHLATMKSGKRVANCDDRSFTVRLQGDVAGFFSRMSPSAKFLGEILDQPVMFSVLSQAFVSHGSRVLFAGLLVNHD